MMGKPEPTMRPCMTDERWACSGCTILVLMLLTAHILPVWESSDASGGLETAWLAPSLCPSSDRQHYVSYIQTGRVLTESPSYDEGSSYDEPQRVGEACPSEAVQSMVQDFELPSTLAWVWGSNESLVVFRSSQDSITLSFELHDARGLLLLSERAVLLEAFDASAPTGADERGADKGTPRNSTAPMARRRLLKRLLKRHSSGTQGSSEALSGTRQRSSEALSGTRQRSSEALSGTRQRSSEALSGTRQRSSEALSGTRQRSSEALSGMSSLSRTAASVRPETIPPPDCLPHQEPLMTTDDH
jgi:hypothetical protein